MFKKTLILLTIFTLSHTVYGQDITSNTLEDQFTDVIEGSNDYQDYKVIKKVKINQLRKNILDTVAALENQIKSVRTNMGDHINQVAALEKELKTTREDLEASREKENGIYFLGILTEKSTYNFIMWSLLLLFLLALLFFIYKYINSHSVTKAAELKLAETEIEFESHRQNALEKEQKLRRKLQDELNKSRKS